MKWTLKLVAEVVPGKPTEYEVATIERIEKFSPATLGLTISEGKAILAGLQKQMVTAQVQHHGASILSCPRCGKAFRTKGYYQSTLRSVYGNVGMRSLLPLLEHPTTLHALQSGIFQYSSKKTLFPSLSSKEAVELGASEVTGCYQLMVRR
jgi:hypothetical protein